MESQIEGVKKGRYQPELAVLIDRGVCLTEVSIKRESTVFIVFRIG